MSDLLLNESPLVIQPSLVRRLGIAEAALVQQLHYWRARATHTHDGETWVYKTYADWSDEIGLSTKACRGALDRLRKDGIVVATQSPLDSRDRTLWWRIDYEVLGGGPHAPGGSPPDPKGTSHAGVPGSTETTSRERGEETRADTAVDKRDQAPPDFPDDLRPSAAEVMRLLNEVAAQHGLPAVKKLQVGRALMNAPKKAHVDAARALHVWAADPPRPIRSLMSTYATFLGSRPDLAGPERWKDQPGTLPANVTPIRNETASERRQAAEKRNMELLMERAGMTGADGVR